MSLILAEGFDLHGYSTNNWPADARWTRFSAGSSYIDSTSGRRSGPCLYIVGGNGTGLTYNWTYLNLQSANSTIIMGMAYKAESSTNPPGSGYPILLFQKGTTPSTDTQLCIHRTSADGLEVRATAGGTLLGSTATGVITPGSYQYIEIKIYCHSSNGSIQIKIDGTEVLNLTSKNTQNAGSGAIQYLHFRNYSESTYDTMIDDFYICDETGSDFNDFQGDIAVIGHVPEADGTYSDWTSTKTYHYDAIDDVGSGYATDYNESSMEGDQDSFTLTPSGTYPSVKAVEVTFHGHNSGAGTAKIKPFCVINSTIYYGDELTLAAGSTDKRSYVWTANPATSGLWSKAAIAAAEFGYEVTEIT